MTQTTPRLRSQQAASIVAYSGATLLICTSAALGSYYAYGVGSTQHVLLGCILAAGALGGELLKPFAFVGAVQAITSWQFVRAVPCLLVGFVCVAYSLSAELALSATSRNDHVAQRSNQADLSVRARDRYNSAKHELQALPLTRPQGQLQATIDGLLLTPGADGCAAINGPVTREVCPKVIALRVELARAVRRGELQSIMDRTSLDQRTTTAVTSADPMADAVVLYAGAVGATLEQTTVATWLHLVVVLFLEIGSALGLVAARAASDAPHYEAVTSMHEPLPETNEPALAQPIKPATARVKTQVAVVDYLKANGGIIESSERRLAKHIGASRSTTRRALKSLVSAKTITLAVNAYGAHKGVTLRAVV